MRILIARLVLASALIGSCLVGCANRGMVAPSEETGSGGGSGGTVALGGSGGSATGGKGGGTGGSGTGGSATGGKGGGTGGSNVDASCSVVTDALFDHSTTSCNATYSFERTTEGATLLAGSQAFTGVSQGVTPNVYCGAGSLAIAATFSGTSGATTKGEVDIPLGVDGGSVDLSGKTLTVHVSANPVACGEDLRFKVILDTASGSPVALSINTVTSNFTTASASLATVAGANATNKLALEAFSTSGYTGTIYVDEINLQ
ncbi:MAG TPA: hypothetical protein VLC06_06510 [Polyangia bacterium]|nr:hypothetical protein [Polyangia bacterium]